MNKTREEQLEAIRGKCIEANDLIKNREWCHYCNQIQNPIIRLADILLAIEKKCGGMENMILDGHHEEILKSYDLRKDDITLQDDSVIQFIFNLLS